MVKRVTLDISGLVFFRDVRVVFDGEQVRAVVDEKGSPRSDELVSMAYPIDESDWDEMEDFFLERDISIEGEPWTTAEDQDDHLGELRIPLDSLNEALAEGRIEIKGDPQKGWAGVVGL